MDPRRRTDAANDGGRVLHRQRRTRKLAVVVAVQNVLVTTCLVVTLYVCWDAQSRTPAAEQTSKDDVHIQFNPIADITGNKTVPFSTVYSSNMMSLEGGDKIRVNCTGPYVLYMYLCYKHVAGQEATGTLQLRAVDREREVLVSFNLSASHEECRGLHSVAYLRDKDKVGLYLSSTEGFKIKTATVGLSYMLGRCEFL